MKPIAEIKPMKETSQLPAQSFNPQAQLALGKKAADALIQVVRQAGLSRKLGQKEYLFYEAWLTLGRFFKLTPKVEWSRPIWHDGRIIAWEARAVVLDEEGREIAAAEAMCGKDEKGWAGRPAYALRSMAQTRACAKALRSVLAWVVVLAGFQPTPAEEIDGTDAGNSPNAN